VDRLIGSTDTLSPHGVSDEDVFWLEYAVSLGRRGAGQVHPNPLVGCVIVRDGVSVGEGWHPAYGAPHAEVEALKVAGDRASGATAYVSLEPCRHWGKTPPCTLALLQAGVRRVVYGAPDPGKDSGGGGAELRERGVEVVGPVFDRARARSENPSFFHDVPERPWVVLKFAVSSDGMIAEVPGVRTTITGSAGSDAVHRLRAQVDAILVGGETARIDNPKLTVRGAIVPRIPPLRIVLTRSPSHIPPSLALLTEPEGAPPVLIAFPEGSAVADHAAALVSKGRATGQTVRSGAPELTGLPGVEWISIPALGVGGAGDGSATLGAEAEGRVDVSALLLVLRERGVRALLVEGGARLAGQLLEADLVDRVVLLRNARPLGEAGVQAFSSEAWHALAKGAEAVPEGWIEAEPPRALGDDVWRAWDRERGFPSDERR